jgi:hypothetical protein
MRTPGLFWWDRLLSRRVLERLDYYDARNWFWIRTAIWFLPAALISVMAHFAYTSDLFDAFSDRAIVSLCAGIGSTLLGVIAGYISMQMIWMKFGWRISYVLNGPFCALAAGLVAVLLCGIVLTFLQADPPDPVGHKAAYEAFLASNDRAYQVMVFATGACAFWGFIFGSWFAMRRDKYFIEPILG